MIAAPLVSHLLVADTGRTSITFGHSFATREGRRLGAVRRVYVRVRDGRPVPLADTEREAAESSRRADPMPDIATLQAGGGPAASDAVYEEKVVATIGPQHCNNRGFDDSHVDHAALAMLTLQGEMLRAEFRTREGTVPSTIDLLHGRAIQKTFKFSKYLPTKQNEAFVCNFKHETLSTYKSDASIHIMNMDVINLR